MRFLGAQLAITCSLFTGTGATIYTPGTAEGAPCTVDSNRQLMSDFELDHLCPNFYYCFWDKKPYTYNETTGVKYDLPEELYPVDPEGKYNYEYNGQAFGYCHCNQFYGFDGVEDGCQERSAGTWFFLLWAIALAGQYFWLWCITIYTLYSFVQAGLFKFNASTETLIGIAITLPCFICFQLGYILTMTFVDQDYKYHNELLFTNFAVCMTTFGVSVLNIAIAWIEVVEKSQKKGQEGNTKLYKRVIYGAIVAYTMCIIFTLIVLSSVMLTGVVVVLALIFMAVVFFFGGKKLFAMLSKGGQKKEGSELTMDAMVKMTSDKVGRACALCLVTNILFTLTNNTNVWLSTPGIEGGMQTTFYIMLKVVVFVRFGGRRGLQKAGFRPIFKVEMPPKKVGEAYNAKSTHVESEEPASGGAKVAVAS